MIMKLASFRAKKKRQIKNAGYTVKYAKCTSGEWMANLLDVENDFDFKVESFGCCKPCAFDNLIEQLESDSVPFL